MCKICGKYIESGEAHVLTGGEKGMLIVEKAIKTNVTLCTSSCPSEYWEILRNYKDKPIALKDMREIKEDFLEIDHDLIFARMVDTEGCFIIYLPEKCPDNVFVHEIMHIILIYEKFPFFSISISQNDPEYRMLKSLESNLTSTIHHFEVYRRMMQRFGLKIDMLPQERQNYLDLFGKAESYTKGYKDQYYFLMQQLIAKCVDIFLIGDKQILDIFEKSYSDTFRYCSSLFTEINEIGFEAPEKMCLSAKHLRRRIINYGERNLLRKKDNDLWKRFEIKNCV
jgi:hypothetical protein